MGCHFDDQYTVYITLTYSLKVLQNGSQTL